MAVLCLVGVLCIASAQSEKVAAAASAAAVQGACCSSVLDALGTCCLSGAVDECGVCDGDSTSCSLHLRLLMQLPNNTDITPGAAASSTWRAGLVTMLQSAYQQVQAAAAMQQQLQVLQVSAKWALTAAAANQLLPSRHLLSVDEVDPSTAAPPEHSSLCPRQSEDNSLFISSSICSSESSARQQTAPDNAAAAEPSSARRLQAAAVLASGWQAAMVEVSVALPSNAGSSFGANAGAEGMGVLQLGYALVSELLLQTDPGQAPAGDGSAELQLQEVLLVQRLGVCGNGLCEVGERALLNAAAEAIKEAAAPCPQVRCGAGGRRLASTSIASSHSIAGRCGNHHESLAFASHHRV